MVPYLSIVVASRNDNHGGDMLKRMSIFIKGLIYQTQKHRVPTELVFVEWNPPQNAPLLHEVLPKPVNSEYLTIRYVLVPPEIHQQYRFAGVMPLYQMIAKNVGIRRAKANFILCTNVDLIFSDELFGIFAQQNLNKNCFYRANRCDIPAAIEDSWSFEQQLHFAKTHILKRAGLNNKYLHLINAHPLLTKNKWIAKKVNYCVDLKRKWLNNEQEVGLWTLDTDACGDFTLMSAKAWQQIQGYPELDLYSIHIDSMGLIAAAALGYKQIVFDETACTYHIDHADGWAAMNPIEKVHFWHKKPGIGWDIVSQCGQYLLQHKTGYHINPDTWGFSHLNLQEIRV